MQFIKGNNVDFSTLCYVWNGVNVIAKSRFARHPVLSAARVITACMILLPMPSRRLSLLTITS
jgi:hypothetical protein